MEKSVASGMKESTNFRGHKGRTCFTAHGTPSYEPCSHNLPIQHICFVIPYPPNSLGTNGIVSMLEFKTVEAPMLWQAKLVRMSHSTDICTFTHLDLENGLAAICLFQTNFIMASIYISLLFPLSFTTFLSTLYPMQAQNIRRMLHTYLCDLRNSCLVDVDWKKGQHKDWTWCSQWSGLWLSHGDRTWIDACFHT